MPDPATRFDLSARFERVEQVGDSVVERTLHAHDKVLARDVLIKLPGTAASGWSAPVKERLLREARALAKIRHDGVASILWVEQTPNGPLCVFDLPLGETLEDRLSCGPLGVDEAVRLGIEMAEALAAVHCQGIVHRAVGPRAIRILPDGRAQIGAFTFAKEFTLGDGSSLAHAQREDAEIARHLPDYSAPEQVLGLAAEPRTDVYALGCTLFRCLAGHEAFDASTKAEPMPDLRDLRSDVSKQLTGVIRTCAMHAKTARYPTMQAVADALRSLPQTPASGGGSHKTTVIAVVAVALLMALVVFGRDLWSGSAATRGGDRFVGVEDARYQRSYGPKYARVHGLFVGIGAAYAGSGWPQLQNPAREVLAVSDQLSKNDAQWQRKGAITILRDPDATFANIERELARIRDEAEPEDAVLIYFAGHGTKIGRSFGLCTADVSGTVENGTGYLRRDVLNTWLDKMRAKHVLVVLDCCHSGAVFDVVTRGRDPEAVGKGKVVGEHHRRNFSREFLCSAAANEKASDGAGLSPFCKLLLAQLRQPATAERQYVAARYLSAHIAEAMDQKVAHSSNMQVPTFRQMAEQEGSFVFRLGKR